MNKPTEVKMSEFRNLSRVRYSKGISRWERENPEEAKRVRERYARARKEDGK
jgi:hypothetical protein